MLLLVYINNALESAEQNRGAASKFSCFLRTIKTHSSFLSALEMFNTDHIQACY